MTSRDALLFIGKCLTLRQYPERIAEVRELIRSDSVDWENIVWNSTNQLVFPAIYLQLKGAGLLGEMPSDLVEYMADFTEVNRKRNRGIIDQALEITSQLNEIGISPLFLKGTAHLLDGLYEDIAERMVGDIDLLVEENDMVKAAEILIKAGYEPLAKYDSGLVKMTKHYPRLKNENRIAAVEIHRQILLYPFYRAIEFNKITKKRKKLNLSDSAFVLSDEHQIIHTILNVQLNDSGYYYAGIFLRQIYDLLLLSSRKNPLLVVQDFGSFFHRMNANLALSSLVLGNPESITYRKNFPAKWFLFRIIVNLKHPRLERLIYIQLYFIQRFANYGKTIIRCFYNKHVRQSLIDKLGDRKWYIAHFNSYRKI